MFRRKKVLEISYPTPTVTKVKGYHTIIGWKDQPYYVDIYTFDYVSLSVKHLEGYVDLRPFQRGYIASCTDSGKTEQVLHSFLQVAWELNHNPKYRMNTEAMVSTALARMGLEGVE